MKQFRTRSDAQTKSRRNTWSGMKKSSGITCLGDLVKVGSTDSFAHELSARHVYVLFMHVYACCSKKLPSTNQVLKEAKSLLLQD
jgi:hypothetical protein